MHIDLPLHGGHCPRWLFEKMVQISEQFLILFVKEKGTYNLLQNLSHPLWYQSLGCYLGFDWHSSGLTTVVGGAITKALENVGDDIGIFVAGGKGKNSLNTPNIIYQKAKRYDILHYKKYQNRSKLLAKTDNSLIQDGYNLYYHIIFFDKHGNYTVVQQGMNNRYARRYHWNNEVGEKLIKLLKQQNIKGLENKDFKIISHKKYNNSLNLISQKSFNVRDEITQIIKYIQKHYKMPDHHIISKYDFNYNKLINNIYSIKNNINSFYDIINTKGIGPKIILNLVHTSQLIFGDTADRSDPARFSFTHGGKDGTPYFPNNDEYDKSIYNLKEMINKSKRQLGISKFYFK